MHSQVVELQRLGVDTHVVCERTENIDQFDVADIHCLADENRLKQIWDKGVRKLRIRRHLNYLVEIGKKTGADILHSHFGNIGWANLGAVRRLGIKHVVTFYGLDVNKLPTQFPVWRKRYRRLFEEVDLVLCEGSHMANCINKLGCPEQKIRVQHLGVDVERIEFIPRKWQPGETLRVLISATFREKKGIPIALEMLGRLQDEVPLEITVIGETSGEQRGLEERELILKTIARHRLQERTRMLGFQPHRVLFEEAYRHHVFVSPSITAADGDTEGGAPVSIIEMSASGMPVVSTLHCDIPEVLRPEASRFLAPERDVTALLKIMKALVQNWGDFETPLANLRAHIKREYDSKVQGARLADIYRDIVSHS
jgi:colanic acid/amylovoran biosynthesis glycosyltransferase